MIPVTPKGLRALAERYEIEADQREHEAKSLRTLAKAYREEAANLEHDPGRLPSAESSVKLQGVTAAQLKRRGVAISKGKAAKSKDRLLEAISASSKWHSQDEYARTRLRISPSALVGYRKGDYPCPVPVAMKVSEDFGISYDYWPKGVVN